MKLQWIERAYLFGLAIGLGVLALAANRAAADPTGANPAATPIEAIQQLYKGLIGAAEAGLDVQQRYARLKPVIEATHDLPYIAELTIHRQWAGLKPAQRRQFVQAFERLSIMNYASRFGGLKKGMLAITGSRPAREGRAEVQAKLTTPKGKAIPFQYLLHEIDGGWKIVNILADNVSDLALKRSEYREVLEKGSIADLIRHIEKQTEDLADRKSAN